MPSEFAPSTSVEGKERYVPSIRDSKWDAFHVAGPPGWYRVFAIWTAAPLGVAGRLLNWVPADRDEKPDNDESSAKPTIPRPDRIGPPLELSLTHLVSIRDALKSLPPRPNTASRYVIMTTTYEVLG